MARINALKEAKKLLAIDKVTSKIGIIHETKIFLIIILVIVITSLYLYGAIQHSKRVNTNMSYADQSAYMNFSKKMYESKYTYLGDRNRMPVYPFFQSLFYNRNMDDQKFFIQGKYINIALSILILLCLFFIFKKHLGLFSASNLLLITAFSVYMFKAAYFQCEILFYFLNFLCFLLMIKILIQPSWKVGIITGVMLGLTYLTKAAILPAMLLFLFFSISKCIYLMYCFMNSKSDTFYAKQCKSKCRSQLFCSIFLVLAFMLTIYPYISDNKKIFGHYFYNVNTTFYIWYDSCDEAEKGTEAHGDRVGWPDMTSDSIPSAKKYFSEHNLKQIRLRITDGFNTVIGNCRNSYGYFRYCRIYLAFFLFLFITTRNKIYNIKYIFPAAFILFYFFLYLLLYAWYAPLCSYNRLILAQFLPFMFVISFAIVKYSEKVFIISTKLKINILIVFNLLILCIFVPNLFLLMKKVLVMFGGA